MAILTVRQRVDLGITFVLAPERYDPRRLSLKGGAGNSVALGGIASTVKQTINPQSRAVDRKSFLVFDTSDVSEGVVVGRKEPVPISELGSTKKRIRPNDLLISRLRPYLRQVAFVDEEIPSGDELVCSTEFFVLRSETASSIAFLVPFLLSVPVQKVLSASQEGGHHPRFNEDVLLTLPIPESIIAGRDEASAEVIRTIRLYREMERSLNRLVATADAAWKKLG